MHLQITNITIFEFSVNQHVSIIPNKCVFVEMGAFPFTNSKNLFSLIADVIDWSCKSFPIFEVKCSEHTSVSKAHSINSEGLILPECEFSLPD